MENLGHLPAEYTAVLLRAVRVRAALHLRELFRVPEVVRSVFQGVFQVVRDLFDVGSSR